MGGNDPGFKSFFLPRLVSEQRGASSGAALALSGEGTVRRLLPSPAGRGHQPGARPFLAKDPGIRSAR